MKFPEVLFWEKYTKGINDLPILITKAILVYRVLLPESRVADNSLVWTAFGASGLLPSALSTLT